jgi:hypothetical protein
MTHKDVFNLGMAGTFSPVQSFMSIKKFEKVLKFDTCFIFLIVPSDEKLLTTIDENRFRPYWINDSIIFQKHTVYTAKKSIKVKLANLFQQYSYIGHLVNYYKARNELKATLLRKKEKEPKIPSTRELQKINRLFCEAYPDKFFYFVLTPTLNDEQEKIKFCFDKAYPNSKLLDLRQSLNKRSDFFICNPHWNKNGHKAFADNLFQAFKVPGYRSLSSNASVDK